MSRVRLLVRAEELFQCDQILSKGPGEHAGVDYRQSWAFTQAMRGADLA
ncbi:hypothetical protein OHQ88_13220 [Micromonospora zamorensis]|uniref:Uncharacterized protein n=1 Tax=Micromonospora zamorensis TaxID=709883 RepID=A0ABZ1PMF7_9ACTN|nr:hypothetical protein OHA01_10820 [Micromonospora zamorensis]